MSKRAQRSIPRATEEEQQAISTEIARVSVAARRDEPLEHEVIVDPDRIRRTLWRLAVDETHGVARESRSPLPYRPLRLVRMQPARDLPLSFDVVGGCSGTHDVEIQLFSPRSVYRFSPDRRAVSAGLLTTALPNVLVRQRHRRGSRAQVEGVHVSFAHPAQPHVRVVRDVLDVSLAGLGMRVGRFDGLAKGDTIEAVIDWQERARVRVRGVVRHVSTDLEGLGEVAGIELAIGDDEDGLRWRTLVERALWSHTVGDGGYAQDVWECLVSSGYCNLSDKSEGDFEDLPDAYAGAMRSLASSPELGSHLVIPSGRGVEATLSTLRIYDRAHFLYALAKQPGRAPSWIHGKRAIRDLYVHAVERMEADPHAQWMIVWVQAQAELSRHIHHDLVARYTGSKRGLVMRVDVMEAQAVAPAPIPGHVGAAREAEIARVLARIATMRSPHYLDAHDLVPERFELTALRRAWARSGLVRERMMIVAREGDEIAAAAIVELASEGLHLFRLFDTVRTFVLRPGGERHLDDLLRAARRFFADRRKPTFVYVREDLDGTIPDGFRSLALTDVTLLPASLYPELLEHVHDLTAYPEPPASPAKTKKHG